ncbi:TPA: hypothetical protein HH715_004969, partial [Escherichia coli]|nr:hypothetical protein [Escherichia coli]
RSARGSSGRYGLCNRLSVLYFPFSETTPCAAPSAKGDDKFITTDYLQQCRFVRLAGLRCWCSLPAVRIWPVV